MKYLSETLGSVAAQCTKCNKKHYIYIKDECKKNNIGYEFNFPFKCKCGEVHTNIKYNYVDDEGNIVCPECKSSNFTSNKQGFGVGKAIAGGIVVGGIGILSGFIGSNKIKITCLNCGYGWKIN